MKEKERLNIIKNAVENSTIRKKQDFTKGRLKSKLRAETKRAVELLVKSGLDKRDAYDIVERDTRADHSIIGGMVASLKNKKLRYTLETIKGGL